MVNFIQCQVSHREISQIQRPLKLCFLGTGNPNPSPTQSGCSIAIIVGNTPYIIDFGPGLIRKAAQLTPYYGGNIAALDIKNIKYAFLPHLHSDHTTGYPDKRLLLWETHPEQVHDKIGCKKEIIRICQHSRHHQ